ncbi:MAG: pyridoxamine 5'-phosphate oxidase family protein [Pseudonocardia sp.]|nr:pyridoxamine 5'-phosphate oxidase family protein [Pseudonocardia sp.]
MPRGQHPDTARTPGLDEIDGAGCLRLLASAQIGRVIYTEVAMPAAHPVNYLLDGEEIVFRTGGGGKLAAAVRGTVVGFQVDEIDVERRSGWSVLGVGEAYEILDADRLDELACRLPTPWAPHRTGHCISIPLQRLTGRWLSPPE